MHVWMEEKRKYQDFLPWKSIFLIDQLQTMTPDEMSY